VDLNGSCGFEGVLWICTCLVNFDSVLLDCLPGDSDLSFAFLFLFSDTNREKSGDCYGEAQKNSGEPCSEIKA
jgi:hypothetical protein